MLALKVQQDYTCKIEEVDIPQLKNDGEVLIKLHFAALNRRDYWITQNKYPGIQFGVTLGSDGSGTVEKVKNEKDKNIIGKNVVINPNNDWGDSEDITSLGYSILGMPVNGTFAHYIVVNKDRIHEIPSHLDLERSAAIPLAGLTAFRAVKKGEVSKDKNVLITGIGGGVAQFCAQFCVNLGAQVWVTSGSEIKGESAIKNLGVFGYQNYKEENWEKKLMGKGGLFDVIIDSSGGPEFSKLITLANLGAKIVTYGSTNGKVEGFNIFKLFLSQISIIGTTMGSDREFKEMMDFIEKYKIIPTVDSTLNFLQILDQFEKLKNQSQLGKLLVSFENNEKKPKL